MRAGPLNRRVRIEARQSGVDEAGQPIETWATVAEVWASIRGQTGMGAMRESQGNVLSGVSRYSIRIRFRDGLDAGMRVVCGSQAFEIRHVQLDFERREWADLVCEVVE